MSACASVTSSPSSASCSSSIAHTKAAVVGKFEISVCSLAVILLRTFRVAAFIFVVVAVAIAITVAVVVVAVAMLLVMLATLDLANAEKGLHDQRQIEPLDKATKSALWHISKRETETEKQTNLQLEIADIDG